MGENCLGPEACKEGKAKNSQWLWQVQVEACQAEGIHRVLFRCAKLFFNNSVNLNLLKCSIFVQKHWEKTHFLWNHSHCSKNAQREVFENILYSGDWQKEIFSDIMDQCEHTEVDIFHEHNSNVRVEEQKQMSQSLFL